MYVVSHLLYKAYDTINSYIFYDTNNIPNVSQIHIINPNIDNNINVNIDNIHVDNNINNIDIDNNVDNNNVDEKEDNILDMEYYMQEKMEENLREIMDNYFKEEVDFDSDEYEYIRNNEFDIEDPMNEYYRNDISKLVLYRIDDI